MSAGSSYFLSWFEFLTHLNLDVHAKMRGSSVSLTQFIKVFMETNMTSDGKPMQMEFWAACCRFNYHNNYRIRANGSSIFNILYQLWDLGSCHFVYPSQSVKFKDNTPEWSQRAVLQRNIWIKRTWPEPSVQRSILTPSGQAVLLQNGCFNIQHVHFTDFTCCKCSFKCKIYGCCIFILKFEKIDCRCCTSDSMVVVPHIT